MGRMVLKWAIILAVALVLFYVSRFWPFELWARRGGLADYGLRPQGGLLQVWLRGTGFAPFELVIWALASFGILTLVEKLFAKLSPA